MEGVASCYTIAIHWHPSGATPVGQKSTRTARTHLGYALVHRRVVQVSRRARVPALDARLKLQLQQVAGHGGEHHVHLWLAKLTSECSNQEHRPLARPGSKLVQHPQAGMQRRGAGQRSRLPPPPAHLLALELEGELEDLAVGGAAAVGNMTPASASWVERQRHGVDRRVNTAPGRRATASPGVGLPAAPAAQQLADLRRHLVLLSHIEHPHGCQAADTRRLQWLRLPAAAPAACCRRRSSSTAGALASTAVALMYSSMPAGDTPAAS